MTVVLAAIFGVAAVVAIGVAIASRRRAADVADEYARRLGAAEGALADTRATAQRLLEALGTVRDGVVIADRAGTVVFRNPTAERFHGARRSEAVAEDLVERLLDRALIGETVEQELSLFGPPRVTLGVSASPMTADGQQIGAVAIVRDMTEVRRIEQVRRDFVANVSHELKTPIGAMGLLAETFLDCDDVDVSRRLADQMVNEAARLGRIVEDLLDLSLIETQEAPTRDQVPVRVLVHEAVERVRAVALVRSIPLLVQPIPDSLTVRCDAARVVGAIMNLLDNAVKYSDEGGSVEVDAALEGDQVVITVADHGIGIPSEDLERVFERFYRVDKARSRATGGTGLGLSIVRHVAHAHGGDVTVTSQEGNGSIFRFSLPAADAHVRPSDLLVEST